ncbi:Inactive Tyrosine-Protein Kinase 7, partial [Manis pentadactyla]
SCWHRADSCGAGSWAGEVTDTLYFLRREEAGRMKVGTPQTALKAVIEYGTCP